MTRIEVHDIYGNVLPGIPTPRLMQAGGGEAYFVPSGTSVVGIWYLHEEPRYTSPDGTYKRVRIANVEDWYPGGYPPDDEC